MKTLILTYALLIAVAACPLEGLAGTDVQHSGASELELQAMILTPVDLGDAGLANHPIEVINGEMQSVQQTIDDLISRDNLSPERVNVVVPSSELQRSYRHVYVFQNPTNVVPSPIPSRRIISSVFEFPNEAAASAAFLPFAKLVSRDAIAIATASSSIGDESRLSEYFAALRGDSGLNPEFSLTFRTGRLIGNVIIRDMLRETKRDAVVLLAERLNDQVLEIQSSGGPGLSHFLTEYPVKDSVMTTFEGYTLFTDSIIAKIEDSAIPANRIQSTDAAGAGALEGYDQWQLVFDDVVGAVSVGFKVYRFPDEDTASAWINILPERYGYLSTDDIRVSDATGIGDEAYFVNIARSAADGVVVSEHFDAVRVGSFVAIIYGSELPADVARELLTAQAQCLANDGCESVTSATERTT